ncbi:MAG: LysR family transcriptional regulator [Myxococcales bacterium]|nr:LysR family transcriptional regulator [Myxococcales bacterium]
MDWLNYHHLLYFFTVAREGGLAPAGKRLRLSQSALSGQIKRLEQQLDHPLFVKRGRKLEMTETGRMVYQYAEDIFGLGNELLDAVRGRGVGRVRRLKVGISDLVAKSLVRELLSPALADPTVVLTCYEDRFERLLLELANHEIDVVIAETPVPAGSGLRAFNHLLGESTLTLLAPPSLAPRLRARFPRGLDGAPVLLPLPDTVLRRELDAWFIAADVRPIVRAEAEDSALLKAFAADGMGAVFVPSVIAGAVGERYGLVTVREVPELRERYYAISAERRLTHPAVIAIRAAARSQLFS